MFENGQLTVLSMNEILPNRFQPRIRFDEEKLEELAESIGKYGVIQPIVVRPVGGKYEIIAGERRFKASKLANKSTIPAIVVNLSDKDSEEIALLENVQRQELSPIEEAVSYKRILDMGYITQEQLAKKLGKSQSTIANKIRLLNLDDEVQSYLLNNKISERHARSLLRIPDKEKQVEMLHRIVEERLTVKQTDREIEKLREETKIENKPVKPVEVNVTPVSESPSNLTDEVESLFDESENVKEQKGGNTMDIDKIMREAKDINVPQEPAPKDISGLMQPRNDIQSEPIVREEPTTQVNLENSRFINVAPQSEQPKSTPQPSNGGVTFDSMFNQHIDVQSTQPVQSNVNNVQTSVNSIPVQNPVNNQAVVEPINSNNGAAVQNSSPAITPQPNNMVNNQTSNVSTINQNSSPVVDPTVQPNNIVNTPTSNDEVSEDTKRAISSAVSDALKRFNEHKNQKVVQSTPTSNVVSTPIVNSSANEGPANVSPVPEVVNDTNTNASVNPNVAQSTNVTSQVPNQQSIPSTDIIADNTLNEYAIKPSNVQPAMASAMTQEVKSVNNQAHFAQIVKLLRECADKIEQNGYFVSMDEMDLGNQYKVTFTIDKE